MTYAYTLGKFAALDKIALSPHTTRNLINRAIGGGILGAGSGAIAGGEEHRGVGALAGGLGGALGMGLGGLRGVPGRPLYYGLAGGLSGGAAARALAPDAEPTWQEKLKALPERAYQELKKLGALSPLLLEIAAKSEAIPARVEKLRRPWSPAIASTLAGTGFGAGLGALSAGEDNRGTGAIIGGALGGLGGALRGRGRTGDQRFAASYLNLNEAKHLPNPDDFLTTLVSRIRNLRAGTNEFSPILKRLAEDTHYVANAPMLDRQVQRTVGGMGMGILGGMGGGLGTRALND